MCVDLWCTPQTTMIKEAVAANKVVVFSKT
jgi:hypothetical protein